MILFTLITLLCQISFSKDIPGDEIWTSQVSQSTNLNIEKNNSKSNSKSSTTQSKKTLKTLNSDPGNLPKEYLLLLNRQSNSSELVIPPKGAGELFRGIKVGDSISVWIPHSVIAFPDEKAPVVGEADSGTLKGLKFVGESYLEINTKRIFINFSRLILGHQTYDLKGSAVSASGQPGLTGEYHSREAEYFSGDFIASFAAGYFDGLVPRKTNAFGQIETDQSIDSAVKKGLASGSLSTAERFKEKLKKVPEFSEIKGPFNLKILILEQAKTTN